MSTVLHVLKSSVRPLLEFIYPPTCFICESLMETGRSRVCADCWSTMEPVTDEDPLLREMTGRLTGNPSSSIQGLIPLFHFEKGGILQEVIHQLKYSGMTILGVELGRRLGERIQSQTPGFQIDGIIPVPLHPTKLRERGYNQSEYIARGIREIIPIPIYSSLLRRHKYTVSQTHLTAAERKENVGEAFALNNRYLLHVEGKRFLLVDDVITTGATTEACAQTMRSAGALELIACSIALAEHSSQS